MPLWTDVGVIKATMRGRIVELFANEILNDDDASIAVALVYRTGMPQNITFQINFPNTPPAAIEYQPQVSLLNADASFYDIGPALTDVAGGDGEKVTINDVNARFARLHAVTSGGVETTARLIQA